MPKHAETMILDIGCGERRHSGTIGVDIVPLATVDVVCNVNSGLPFKDNSNEGIHASHILEHVDDLVFTMEELYRICKPGAWIEIRVPHASTPTLVWADPTHKRGFTIGTFAPFSEDSNVKHYSNARFKVLEQRLLVASGGFGPAKKIHHKIFIYLLSCIEKRANRNKASQMRAERWWAHWIGFSELYIKLEVIK